jgi:hypothetical protein
MFFRVDSMSVDLSSLSRSHSLRFCVLRWKCMPILPIFGFCSAPVSAVHLLRIQTVDEVFASMDVCSFSLILRRRLILKPRLGCFEACEQLI